MLIIFVTRSYHHLHVSKEVIFLYFIIVLHNKSDTQLVIYY